MFQIQAAQDVEAALEGAQAARAAAEAQLGSEAAAMQRQVAELEAALAAAKERRDALREASAAGARGAPPPAAVGAAGQPQAATAQDASLASLTQALAATYEAAGFAPDASVTPLQMLQKVEARLEECLAAIGPPGTATALAAEAVECGREKERRQAARAHKLAAQQAEHVRAQPSLFEGDSLWRLHGSGAVHLPVLAAAASSHPLALPSCASPSCRRRASSGCWSALPRRASSAPASRP